MTEFIVMTASAKMPSSCWGIYRKVAVLEVKKGTRPSMISARAKGVVRIVSLMDKLHYGKGTARSEFARALVDAQRLCDGLNAELRMTKAAMASISSSEGTSNNDRVG